MTHPNAPLSPSHVSRRSFLATAGTTAAALGLTPSLAAFGAEAPSNKVVVGVMGISRSASGRPGRGSTLASTLASLPGVEIAYLCDVDSRCIEPATKEVMEHQTRKPTGVEDFRRILDDQSVDALAIAAPNHWHAPAAIAAIAAGKHAYVEKPCCHNPQEGLWLVEAARKHDRRVQHGTQRRSWPSVMEAMQRLKEGDIGEVLSAKTWYFNDRPTIGNGRKAPIPEWLNWDQWQGPAPRIPFKDNYVHYNWHWFWHWGNGEVGNNGVHSLDLARWGMGVDYPDRVLSSGGKYRYPEDDQQTPDTNLCTYTFGDRCITWEGRSWGGRTPFSPKPMVAFYGTKGSLSIGGNDYKIYDNKHKEIESVSSPVKSNAVHLENFVESIRGNQELNAEIEEGYKSALMCHLANIAYQNGGVHEYVDADSEIETTGWSREYEPGWKPTF